MPPLRAGMRKLRFGTAAFLVSCGLALAALACLTLDRLSQGVTFLLPVDSSSQSSPRIRAKLEVRGLRRSAQPSFRSFSSSAVPALAGASLTVALLRARGRSARGAMDEDGKLGKVNEEMTESAVEEAERKMMAAAEAGKFEEAAKYNQQLLPAQLDDEGNVLIANRKFYEAFNARSLPDMKNCWYNVPFAQCIHPYDEAGHQHAGYTDICRSFERIFRESKNQSTVAFDRVKVNVRGGTAIVTCMEKVTGKQHRTTLRASHIFRKSADNRWKIVHRHASKQPGDMMDGDEDFRDQETYRELQKVMRAAQALGNSVVIRPWFGPPSDHDAEDDGPFGIGGNMAISQSEVDDDGLDEDDSDDEFEDSETDDEIFVEEEEDTSMETIRNLRKLEDSGVLTRKQKILLLEDMSDSPKDNKAQRAFDLLLRNVNMKDSEEYQAAMQDFGDLLSLQVSRLQDEPDFAENEFEDDQEWKDEEMV